MKSLKDRFPAAIYVCFHISGEMRVFSNRFFLGDGFPKTIYVPSHSIGKVGKVALIKWFFFLLFCFLLDKKNRFINWLSLLFNLKPNNKVTVSQFSIVSRRNKA